MINNAKEFAKLSENGTIKEQITRKQEINMAENKKKNAEYGNQSITSLKGADRVRKRPAVIFGSDGLEGCEHSFFEILSNSLDEAREGYGDRIFITVRKDMTLEVEDFGRGVPLGWNEKEQRYNWELVYCELYAGGKYNNDDGEAYEFSLGLNGLGACATQYSSEFMNVVSYTKEAVSTISFKSGEPIGELVVEAPTKKRTGTKITWKPDIKVFTDINMPREFFEDILRRQSIVNEGVHLCLKFENEDGSFFESEYYYENGIRDYVAEIIGSAPVVSTGEDDEEAPMTSEEQAESEENVARSYALSTPRYIKTERRGKDRGDLNEYKLRVEAVFCFSNQISATEYYHNSSFLEHGGAPDKATRNAFTKAFENYLKNNGKYNKNESKISFNDIQDSLVFVVNSHSTRTSYENQTKKAITNTFIQEAMTDFFYTSLEAFFAEMPKEAERVAAQVLVNKRSRESAESARINLKKKLTGNLDISNRVEKFVNCRSRDVEKRELYIVEGDSALGSVKLARDPDYQAVMPVRGKTLNCLKSSYDKIFKSEIITDLLRVVGCGIEIKSKGKSGLSQFDLDSLRWSKIIICTDADEDGYQIRTLILTMFYRLLPTLIKLGKIYIAESPLYEITSKDKIQFAYNEKEKNEILAELGNARYTIQRSKGLGENEPEMMSLTTMNPATRRLIQITPEDEVKTAVMFNTLLGDDIIARKDYISMYGAKYLDLADI